MLQFDIFTAIGSCFDLKFSCACSRGILGSLIVNAFHCSFFLVIARKIVKSQDGAISREIGKLQDWSFNGRSTNRRIGRFTGDTRLFPHCQTFHRVAPNHKVAHFTGDAKSQGRAFHGRWPNHRAAHFTGDAKSQKRAFHELPVFTHFSSLFSFF